ncbi:hypothetical protein V6N12_072971 [Hibiscus sabdariffa]|uniref:Uncharacterized protein n=1 Tax=Hibiscus sabdariffa TaxID=183260 RepID=A0ABR2B4Q4_9ROSI
MKITTIHRRFGWLTGIITSLFASSYPQLRAISSSSTPLRPSFLSSCPRQLRRYTSNNDPTSGGNGGGDDEIDPLDTFMQGVEEDLKVKPPPKPKEKPESSKKDVGLTLAADALRAGYDSDEEVYAAAKAVDAGLLEYDSDDNPAVFDKKKIEPIPALDHSSIEY